MDKRARIGYLHAAMLASFLLWGCGGGIPVSNVSPNTILPPPGSSQDGSLDQTIAKLNDLNRGHESDLKWIEKSYKKLAIRSLRDMPAREYEDYKKYVDNGSVFIIVHPAYYVFFNGPVLKTADEPPPRNAVERFLELKPTSAKMAVLQSQERTMRDFLSYMSIRKKLIIIILPRAYKTHKGYNYYRWFDEYTRYINQVTDGSDSVLYLESKSPTRGYLRDDDMVTLIDFLASMDPKRVLIGGGYVGRCVENFYLDLIDEYGKDSVYLVPEISAIAPAELDEKLSEKLLGSDKKIDPVAITAKMSGYLYSGEDSMPQEYDIK